MTTLHAGGKFEGEGYQIAGGLHGVGASVVNALSEWLKVYVHRDDGKYFQAYARGQRQTAVKKLETSKLHGTVVLFKPDPTVFSDLIYNWDRIVNHLRGQAYLVKGVRIRVIDARQADNKKLNSEEVFYLTESGLELPTQTFYFEGGLRSYISFYAQKEKPLHKTVFYLDKNVNGVQVEIAFQYLDDIAPRETSFANNTATPEGGMHLTGFRTALTRTLNDYARKNNLLKDNDGNLTGDDVREEFWRSFRLN